MSNEERAHAAMACMNTLQIVLEMYDQEDLDMISVAELKRIIKHFELAS